MKIVAFFDGRPGHEKQTRGILKALAALCPLWVEEVHLPQNSWFDNMLLTGDHFLFANTDLLLGAGTGTHAPMLAAKLRHRLPAVTVMAPDWLWRWAFDLCFVPIHDGLRPGKNIFQTIGPPTHLTDQGRHEAKRGLILIGGADAKSHDWRTEEILASVIDILKREHGVTWHISSSPRTPAATEAVLVGLPERFPHCRFFPFQETPAGWVENEYHSSSQVWVTADSISMVYEALAAGCSLGLIPVPWKKADNKFHRSAVYLAEHGYVRLLADWREGQELRPPPTSLLEARRCAEEIARRWCPES